MIQNDFEIIDKVRKDEKLYIGKEFEKLVKSMGMEELLLDKGIMILTYVNDTLFWNIFVVRIIFCVKTKEDKTEIVEMVYQNEVDIPFVSNTLKFIETTKQGIIKKREIEQTKMFKILYDNIENMVYALIVDTPAFAKYKRTIRNFKRAAKKNGYNF